VESPVTGTLHDGGGNPHADANEVPPSPVREGLQQETLEHLRSKFSLPMSMHDAIASKLADPAAEGTPPPSTGRATAAERNPTSIGDRTAQH
jgi:hypothetical protein